MSGEESTEALAARLLDRRSRTQAAARGGSDLGAFTPSCHPEGAGLPVFVVPGLWGAGYGWIQFGRTRAPDRPLFVLQPPGFDWWGAGLRSIEQMAAHLAERIRALRPRGPYALVGTSAGGQLAHRAAGLLQAAGEVVAGLMLVDTDFHTGADQLPDSTVEKSPEELAANAVVRQGQQAGRALLGALREHRPTEAFAGAIDFLLSTHAGRPRDRDRRLEWAGLATRGLRIHPVPETHDHLVQAGNFGLFERVFSGWDAGAVPAAGLSIEGLDTLFPPLVLKARYLGGAWLSAPGIEARQVSAPLPHGGALDRVSRDPLGIVVSGWARDPDRKAPAREVLVFLDGRYAGRAFPGERRDDVAAATGSAALGASGFHSFIEVRAGEGGPGTRVQAVAVGAAGLAELAASVPLAW